MAFVDLGRADMALYSDPVSTWVQIPQLMAAPRKLARAGTTITFEGDEYPTAFRGSSRTQTLDFTARYSAAQQPALVALITLIDETAPAAADSRLLLRTHVAEIPGLDPSVAVEVFEVTITPLIDSPGAYDLQFTATVVGQDL